MSRFVYHTPTFRDVPMGFARCLCCHVIFDAQNFITESCPGIRPPAEMPRPLPAGAVPCALCGAPVAVASEHRAVVEGFGTTCDECFEVGIEAAA